MITQKQLKELFIYDPDTGILTNRIDRGRKSIAGSIVGSMGKCMYLQTFINSKRFLIHRIIFLYVNGYLPDEVDHVDRNNVNNKIDNLRAATRSENQYNSKLRKDSKSGIKGVSWHKTSRLWLASLKVNGELKRFGYFWDKETAGQVIRIARIKYHGEFCNHG